MGIMVGQCYLLDGIGFPYLSECCYYSLCGQTDRALTSVSLVDLSDNVKALVNDVS